MRSRTSLYLLALLFLFGCSGGGSSSVGGGIPAPPPGPQLVSMKIDVEVPEQAQRAIQGRSQILEVVAEVVDRNTPDPGALSGRRIVSRGSASVGEEDRTVRILLDIIPGIWDIYIFGLDAEGKVVAVSTIDQLAITPGVVLEQKVNLQFQSQSVVVNPPNQTILVGEQQQFSALVFLPSGTSTSVTWISDDPAIASVDANGLATGMAPGTTNIRAISTVDNSLQGFAQLTVLAATVQSLDLVFSDATNTVQVGQVGTSFLTTANLSNGTTQDVTGQATYTIGDPTILAVDSAGVVTALAAGTTTVQASLPGVAVLSNIVTITVLPNLARVVVVESNGAASQLHSFSMDQATGTLTPVDTLGLGGNPSRMAADQLNNLFSVIVSGVISPFTIDPAGNLTALTQLGLADGIDFPQALACDNQRLYVSNNPAAGNDPVLTFLFNGTQYAPLAGAFLVPDNIVTLFVSQAISSLYTGSNNPIPNFPVDQVNLDASGAPVSLGGQLQFTNTPRQIALSANNDFAFVATSTGLHTVDIDANGTLLGVVDAQPPTFANPTGIAVHPNGNFVYLMSTAGNSAIDVFAVDASGLLTPVQTLPIADQVFDLAIDPSGAFLIFPGLAGDLVAVHSIDPATGNVSLAPVTTATVNAPFVLDLFP